MSSPLYRRRIGDHRVTIVATDRADGDVHPDRVPAAELIERQVRSTGGRWTMLDEVHGIDVVEVDHVAASDPVVAGVGDVLVANRRGVRLAVWTADCAPIFLVADDGTVVGAHGGWKGLADGVVDVAVAAACRGGGRVVAAVIGPVIGPCCYEFGLDDLYAVAAGTHARPESIAGRTGGGAVALDVVAAVGAALAHHGVELDAVGPCTGCDDRWFSHRVRSDAERQATVAIVEAVAA